MVGGKGNDTYLVDDIGDKVVETGPAADIDTVESLISYTLGANVEELFLLGSANIDGTGNSLANQIVGNGGDNLLRGMGGNDRLSGGEGDDLSSAATAMISWKAMTTTTPLSAAAAATSSRSAAAR